MVVMDCVPIADTGNTHERTAWVPRCTVHAPHCAMPQPNLVPVRPRLSRRTQSSGVLAATSTLWRRPFTRREYAGIGSLEGRELKRWGVEGKGLDTGG